MSKKRRHTLILQIGMLLAAFIILTPLLIMLFGSFKDNISAAQFTIAPPSEWLFENYGFVIEKGNVLRAFSNSFVLSFCSTCFGVLFSAMAAFVISRRATRGANRLYNFFLVGMIAPFQIITTYLVLSVLGIKGTFLGLILVYIGVNLPFNIFLFTSFVKTIPREIDEAAFVDGCTQSRLFFVIILPLLKPVIATSGIIFAMSVWNDLQLPLYLLNTPTKWTLPLTVYNFYGQYVSSWNYVFADMVITALPMVIIYLFVQKHIVAGMTAGAVKG